MMFDACRGATASVIGAAVAKTEDAKNVTAPISARLAMRMLNDPRKVGAGIFGKSKGFVEARARLACAVWQRLGWPCLRAAPSQNLIRRKYREAKGRLFGAALLSRTTQTVTMGSCSIAAARRCASVRLD
jgi:hypothetical protein